MGVEVAPGIDTPVGPPSDSPRRRLAHIGGLEQNSKTQRLRRRLLTARRVRSPALWFGGTHGYPPVINRTWYVILCVSEIAR